ncbi:MAG TPA: MFS transporter [Chloroflexia bacterium]|nr:MFS transporter [Chloroflexia bacterium]
MSDSPPAPASAPHLPIPPLAVRRAVLFSLASIGAGMVFTFFNAQLPLYLRDYGLPRQVIGPLTNERSLAGALVLPIVGRLSDRARTRWGKRRPFFAAGVPLMAAALVLLGFRPPLPLMLLTVVAAGGFLFVALGPYQALMADITPPEQRGQMGSFMALAGLGGAVLVTLLAALFWDQHSELVFLAVAAVLLLTFALTFFSVREPAHHYSDGAGPTADTAGPEDSGAEEPAPVPRLGPRAYLRDVVRFRQTGRYIGAMSLYWLAAGGATPFITLFGTETLHLRAREANLLFLVLVLSTAGGTVLVGLLADRLGKKRVLHAGLGVFAVAALAAAGVQDAWQAVAVMVLAGLGNACPTALGVPVLADLMPPRRGGEFIGLASSVWSVVQPLGSFLAGSLVDGFHSDRWAFAFAAFFMAVAAVAMFGVHPDRAVHDHAQDLVPA